MSRASALRNQNSTQEDLLPWADPYIASLMEKLHRQGGRLLGHGKNESPSKNDPSPSLESDSSEMESPYFGDDWSGRGAWRPDGY